MFQSILDNVMRDLSSTDLVRVSLDNAELDFPIVLPFMKRYQLTVERLLSEIERVLQSYEEFVLDDTLGIELVHVQMPVGSGHKRQPFVNLDKMLQDKKCIIQIQNKDKLCCARALITAIAQIEKHPHWNKIRQGRHIQYQLAVDLHQKANIPLQSCGMEEVKKFQNVLPKYQIIVLSKEHFNSIIYEGPEGRIPVYLYLHDGHFDVITKITAFLNRSYFCQLCKKGYNTKETHRCNYPCPYCHHIHEDDSEDWIFCSDCHRSFKNRTCFQ
ncbi:uncharacterized protein LOC128559126 [Mercenaria mercenaria]|uniref:uncharacterized protein LOC128559126 n=1 Tax=Mercenaria mercenaria TaxID=6596 RepID=UPI00234EE17C|nr:uncharacterized protein LOC128559126 [Mercenaria mercenaria]